MTSRVKTFGLFVAGLVIAAYLAQGIGHTIGFKAGVEAGRSEYEKELAQLEVRRTETEKVEAGLKDREEALTKSLRDADALKEELTTRMSLMGIVNSDATSESMCESLVNECAGTIDSLVYDAVEEEISARRCECP